MTALLTRTAALLLAAAAIPVFAQAAPPPGGPGGPPPMGGPGHDMGGGHGPGHDMGGGHGPGHDMGGGRGGPGMRGGMGSMGGVLAGLTPEGRKTLGEAMHDARRTGNDSLDAARDKMLELLEADRLDVPALRRAMSEEHRLGEAEQARRQDSMLAAFQKLSPRDRKAFAVSMRSQHFQMEQRRKDVDQRMAKMRERWGNRGDRPDGPPPAPPQK